MHWCTRPLDVEPLCYTHSLPSRLVLCRLKDHISLRGRLFRRCHCYQMLWRIHQVRYRLHLLAACPAYPTFSNSYLIIIKGLMPAVVRSFYHVFTAPGVNPPWWAVSGHVWIVVFLAFLAPLCFLHRLDSLRHTSYVALFSVCEYTVLLELAGSCSNSYSQAILWELSSFVTSSHHKES
jgi:hypothetical protein